MGIKATDSQGQLKDFGLVMDELGAKFNTLSKNEKSYITTTLFGTYQRNRGLILLSHYNESLKNYELAMNSAGTAEQKFNIYQESTQAKLDKLRTSWESFWQSSIDSNTIKGAIDVLTVLMNHLSNLPTLIGAVTVAILTFSSSARTAIMSNAQLGLSFGALSFSMEAFLGIAKTSFIFLSRIAWPVVIVTAATWAIGKLTGAYQEHAEKIRQLKTENDNIYKSWSKNSDTINDLVDKYEKLNQAQENGNINPEQSQELLNIQNELNKLMPSLTDEIDEQGNAHLKNIERVREELKYAQDLKKEYDKIKVDSFKDDIESGIQNKQQKESSLTTARERSINPYLSSTQRREASLDRRVLEKELREEEQNLIKTTQEYIQAQLSLSGANDKLAESDKKYISEIINKNKEQLNNSDSAEKLAKNTLDQANAIADARDKLSKLPSEDNKNYAKTIDEVRNNLQKEGIELSTVNSLIDEYTKKKNEAGQENNNFNDLEKQLSDKFKSAYNDIAKYNEILNKLNQGKKISAADAKDLIETDEEFIDVIENQNGILTVNQDKLKEIIDKKIENAKATLNTSQTIISETKAILTKLLPSYDAQIAKIQSVAEAEVLAARVRIEALQSIDEYLANSGTSMTDSERQLRRSMASVSNPALQKIRELEQALKLKEKEDKYKSILGGSGAVDLSSSSSDKENKEDDKYWKSVTNELEKYDIALQKIIDDREKLAQGSEEFRNSLHLENEQHRAKINYLKDQIEQQKKLLGVQSQTPKTVTPTSTSTGKGEAVINLAATQVGKTPYGYGDETLNVSVDCSGLVQATYDKAANVKVPRTAQEQYNSAQKISKNELKPGDLVFYSSTGSASNITHVGIYAGKNANGVDTNIEARHSGTKVQYTNTFRDSSNFKFVGAGRYFDPGTSSGISTDSNEALSRYNDLVKELAEEEKKLYENSESWRDDLLLQYDNEANAIKDQISLLEKQNQLETEGSDAYNKNLVDQISLNEQLIAKYKEKEKYLREQLSIPGISSKDYEKLTSQLKEVISLELDAQISLRNQLSSIASDIEDIYKNTYSKIKDAKLESIDEELDYEDKRHQQILDNYEEEKDEFNKLIDSKIDALEKEKDTQDYNKDINDATKEINDLITERNKYTVATQSGDTEAISIVSDLDKQIAEKKESLSDMQSDHEYELRKQNLQDIKDSYNKEVDSKIDAENEKYDATKESLDKQKEYWQDYYDELINDENMFAQMRQDIINGNVENIIASLTNMQNGVDSNMKYMGDSITQNLINKLTQAKQLLSAFGIKTTNTDTTSSSSSSGSVAVRSYLESKGYEVGWSQSGTTVTKNGKTGILDTSGLTLGSDNHYYGTESEISQALKKAGFAKGGVNDTTGLFPLHGKSNSVETIFNASQGKKLFDFINNLPASLPSINIPTMKIPELVGAGSGGLHIDSLITVNGNVDRTVMPQLEDLVNKAANKVADTFKKNLNMSGVYRRV